jgi:uncharacterized OB-fold protein
MTYPLTYNTFKEALAKGDFLGLQCNTCDTCILPPNGVCTACGSQDMKIRSFIKKGTIKTFTVSHVAPEGLKPPYIIAMVELEEGPWLIGNVIDVDPEKANMDLIGKAVSVGSSTVNLSEKDKVNERIVFTFLTGK